LPLHVAENTAKQRYLSAERNSFVARGQRKCRIIAAATTSKQKGGGAPRRGGGGRLATESTILSMLAALAFDFIFN